jgi:hypothetical protein
MQQTKSAPERAEPSSESIRAELELILNSAAFRRSERPSRFLRFVCEAVLDGEGAKLNEYLIAHAVFDRGADYSPGDDSVVRRQAYSLRQKLQEYYLHDGRADSVRIDLPVGRYVPTFHFASAPAPETARPSAVITEVVMPTPPPFVEKPGAAASRTRSVFVVAALMAVAVCAGCVLGWAVGHGTARAGSLDSAFVDIWKPWLSDTHETVICFSTPMTASIQRVTKPFAPDSIPNRISIMPNAEEAQQFSRQLNLVPGGYFYLYPGLAHAKMGEALGSIKLAVNFTKAGVPVRAVESQYLNWDDFRSENIILLGHDEANRWVDPVLNKLPLRLASTSGDKPRRILNLTPQKGERAEYYPEYPKGKNQAAEDYALLSMINGVDGRHRLALVSGVNTEGTRMGLEYLTDPASLRSLVAALKKLDPGHSGNWQFQAVLHTELRDRVPMRPELLVIRKIP